MKNTIVALLSFVLVVPVYAQVTSTPASGTGAAIRQEIQNARAQARQEIQGIRQDMQQQIQAARENFQKTIEAKRAEVKQGTQARVAELKAKLQNIKDARKQATVERIDQNVANLNSEMTSHYATALDQIAAVLGRIVSRTDIAKSDGKDVSAVEAAISNAETAIASARTIVAAQAGKTYTLNIGTEATLKNDVGQTRQALHDDLVKAEDSVKAARDAVRQAAVALGQIPGVDGLKAATTTPETPAASSSQ